MNCPKCHQENRKGGAYCIFCGAPIAADDDLKQAEQALREELDKAKLHLNRLELRLSALEKLRAEKTLAEQLSISKRPEPARAETPAAPVISSPRVSATPPVQAADLQQTPVLTQAPARPQPPPPVQPEGLAKEWEQVLPGNWLARVGIVVLFIGLGLLTKLAIDRDWMGAFGQLMLGLGIGTIFIAGGEYWKDRYRVWSQTLIGGGAAIYYLSFFGAYAWHDFLGTVPVAIFMFLATIIAVSLALRHDSMGIAILGIIGAFLVPVILGAVGDSTSDEDTTGANILIPYIYLLDVGILGLVAVRNWRWLILLGLIGSLMLFGVWYVASDDPSPLLAEGALTGIFFIFLIATTNFHIRWRQIAEPADLTLMSLNAMAYFAVSYRLLWDNYHGWLGGFSLLLAGIYFLLGYVARTRGKENEQLSLFAIGIGVVFMIVAVPVQFGGALMAVAWAAEGTVLMWLSSRLQMPLLRFSSIVVFIVLLCRLYTHEAIVDQKDFQPIANDMVLAFAASIAAFYVAAYWLKRDASVKETWLSPLFIGVANVLTVWLFSAELVNYFGSRIVDEGAGASERTIGNLENARNLSLVALWAVYSLVSVIVGIDRRLLWIRLAGYTLLTIALGMIVIGLNHHQAMVDRDHSTPILNYSFAAFAIGTVSLYLQFYLLHRSRVHLDPDEVRQLPIFVFGANLLSLWVMSAEIVTFVEGDNARNLSLVGLWTVYSLVLVIVGINKRLLWARLAGYLLLTVALGMIMIKLNHHHAMVNHDHSTPILNYSFEAFAIGIVALYLQFYSLQRSRALLHPDEVQYLPAFVFGANFLSLWVLTAEVGTFVEGDNARNLSFTLLWAVYAFVLIIIGIKWRWRSIRLGGLALVGIAVVKLFAVDTFTLESGYRVAAYLTLGILLLAGGFAYQRFSEIIKRVFLE